jgi:hypothetical protein
LKPNNETVRVYWGAGGACAHALAFRVEKLSI